MVEVGFSINILSLAAWLSVGLFLGLVYPEFRKVGVSELFSFLSQLLF
jgi:hypothetical protein